MKRNTDRSLKIDRGQAKKDYRERLSVKMVDKLLKIWYNVFKRLQYRTERNFT